MQPSFLFLSLSLFFPSTPLRHYHWEQNTSWKCATHPNRIWAFSLHYSSFFFVFSFSSVVTNLFNRPHPTSQQANHICAHDIIIDTQSRPPEITSKLCVCYKKATINKREWKRVGEWERERQRQREQESKRFEFGGVVVDFVIVVWMHTYMCMMN